MYKIMNAKELTELIATTEVGKEISFAYEWDESKRVDELESYDVSCWYGFKKVRVLESIYLIMGYYTASEGRCYNMVCSYDKTLLQFVTEFLSDCVDSDTVCVELED
jgi:hypothetical protein